MYTKKVLIIEDDMFIAGLVSDKLTARGFQVTHTPSGKEGVQKALEDEFSVVLLDLMLPDMSGFDVCEAIKKEPKSAKTPIIILSNLGSREDIEKGVALGASAFLIKSSVSPQEIASKIDEVLGIDESAAPPAGGEAGGPPPEGASETSGAVV